jgi:hypothetical protein
MTAVWMFFRAELRGRWRSWLALALLAGVFGGVVTAVAAGARRTDAAKRYLEAQDRIEHPEQAGLRRERP